MTDGVWSGAGVVCQFEAVAKKGSAIGSAAPDGENDLRDRMHKDKLVEMHKPARG